MMERRSHEAGLKSPQSMEASGFAYLRSRTRSKRLHIHPFGQHAFETSISISVYTLPSPRLNSRISNFESRVCHHLSLNTGNL